MAIIPSSPQAIAATSIAGCPLRIADQRVQPSHTATTTIVSPSTIHISDSTIRLRAPGCDMS